MAAADGCTGATAERHDATANFSAATREVNKHGMGTGFDSNKAGANKNKNNRKLIRESIRSNVAGKPPGGIPFHLSGSPIPMAS